MKSTDSRRCSYACVFHAIAIAIALAWILSPLAIAQAVRSSLTGVVTDDSGARVIGASVVLTDVERGYIFKTTTNTEGRYILDTLNPGNYSLSVSATGFAPHTLLGVVINSNEHASNDVTLKIGSTTTSVNVTPDSSPLLQTEDAAIGTTIDSSMVQNIPLVGRNSMVLPYLAPGVGLPQGSSLGSGGSSGVGGGYAFTSNGQREQSYAEYVDGVVTSQADPNPGIVRSLYTPPVDSIQGYTLQQGIYRADTGAQSGGTVINIVSRAGTNHLHGTLYDFEQNNSLNANTFFNDLNHVSTPPGQTHIFGGVLGGPIRKNKTFFFVVYNGTISHSTSGTAAGIPTLAERTGDFGDICTAGFSSSGQCLNANQQLWDPYTAIQTSANGPTAQTFVPYNNLATYVSPGPPSGMGSAITLPAGSGNIIDPVGKLIENAFPTPNVTGNSAYNYYYVGRGHSMSQELDARIDQRLSEKDNLTAKFVYSWDNSVSAPCFPNSPYDPCSNGPNHGSTYQETTNYSRAMGPNTVLVVNGGVIGNIGISPGPATQFSGFNQVTSLGLPSYMETAGPIAAPWVTYSGYSLGDIGTAIWQTYNIGFQTYQVGGSIDLIRGRHEVKIGGDVRFQRQNFYQPGVPAGAFSFGTYGTSEYSSGAGGGNSLASLMVGFNPSGNYLDDTYINSFNWDHDLFVQDTWHVTRKFTLDAGLRDEIQMPEEEASNRIMWFNPNARSPISGYSGGVGFVNPLSGPRTPFNTNYHNFAPRFGATYALDEKTVFRGGYGIFYLPSIGASSGVTGGMSSAWNQYTDTQAYATSTNSLYSGATPYARLSNPFPDGVLTPIGEAQTPLAFIGYGVNAPVRNVIAIPYQQSWTLGVERDLPAQSVLSIYYVGTRGTKLYAEAGGSLNALPESVVNNSSSAQLASLNNTYVSNQLYGAATLPQGCAGYNLLCQTTLPEYQFERPYPQYQSITAANDPVAFSFYNALQVTFRKRLTAGLEAMAAYTHSREIDDASTTGGGSVYGGGDRTAIDPFNIKKYETSLSAFDTPNILSFAYTYALPFGRGQRFGAKWNPWLDGILGGWQWAGIGIFQSGQPIALSQSTGTQIPTWGSMVPTLNGALRKNPKFSYRNLDAYFANPEVLSVTPDYTIGNVPRFIGSVRAPGTENWSMGIHKDFPVKSLGDQGKIELRLESFNTFNHVQFGIPATTIDAGNFGEVTGQANAPRVVQLGGKVYF